MRRRSAIVTEEALASFAALPAHQPDAEDPAGRARIELGRALFHDPRLSKNGDISCASCHPLDRWGVDNQRLSRGSDGRETTRNTLSVYNTAGFFALLWDGRQTDLTEQAKEVLLLPRTMAMTKDRVPEVLRAIPAYVGAFQKAFPGEPEPVTFDNTARALAAFEATLVTRGRWDRFLEGDRAALTEQEKAGFNRFVELGCIACHFGPNVGATMFQKAGLVKPWPDTKDKGRQQITKREADFMVFRVPSLRNVTVTGPYFHDGSVASLDTAIRMMGRHQIGKELDDEDVSSIKSWLGCLTGEIPKDLAAPPSSTGR
jgi:cytochrome c peroxidase